MLDLVAPLEKFSGAFSLSNRWEMIIKVLQGNVLKDVAEAPMDDEVKGILSDYANSLEAQEVDPADSLVSIYLMDTTDDSNALAALWGFSPLRNQWSGAHFSTPKFHPYWEHLIEHQYWFEMLCLLGDDGSGRIIFIPKTTCDVELLEMCRMYSKPE